jgi:hypothetical protein
MLGLAGCGGSPPPRIVPDAPDSSAASKAIELYDANHDGSLDEKELEKAPGLKAYAERIGGGHAGKISADQISARIKAWADAKVGRVSTSIHIMRNGRPLAGAKVTLVPEKFLGGSLKPGEGVTNANGMASISAAYANDPSVRGMSPGFYRVEVTKDGETIPAKYNTESTFGVEVASDAADGPTRFDLKY